MSNSRVTRAYHRGFTAAARQHGRSVRNPGANNPYPIHSIEAECWDRGFRDADEAFRKAATRSLVVWR